jgi:iron complex outermembrane receptor protein
VTTGVQSVSGYIQTYGTKSWAIYGQGRYEFNDQLALTLSGRFTSDKKSFVDLRNNTVRTDSQTWTDFSPQAILEYRFNPDVMAYVKAGRAFKAGVYSATATELYAVDPEHVTQYEVGIKSDPLSWLRLNLAAYYTDYKNIQVNYRTNTVPIQSGLENAGAAEIYGIEAEMVIRPIANLDLRAGMGLMHGEYTDYKDASVYVRHPVGGNIAASIDATGNKITRAPEQTYNLGFNYTIPAGDGDFRLAGNIYHQSKLYWEASNRITTKGFTQVNGEFSWSPEQSYRIALWVENLLDQKRYLHTLTSPTADTASYRAPRTYGVRLSANF